MSNFERPLDVLPGKEIPPESKRLAPLRSANDGVYGDEQESPYEYEKLPSSPVKTSAAGFLENPANRAILHKEQLVRQYIVVAELYGELAGLAEDHKLKAPFSPYEETRIRQLATEFSELKPLISITVEQAEAEFERLVIRKEVEKALDAQEHYAELAVQMESETKEAKRMEEERQKEIQATPERFRGPEDGDVTVGRPL